MEWNMFSLFNTMTSIFFDTSKKVEALDKKEKDATAKLEQADKKADGVKGELDKAQKDLEKADNALQSSEKLVGDAQAELEKETEAQVKAHGELLSLLQQMHSLRQEEAKKAHSRGHQKLQMLQARLDEKIQADEECDDLRAKVITAKGKLEEASEALATCLSTKKVIQAKIDAVETARKSAQTGLD